MTRLMELRDTQEKGPTCREPLTFACTQTGEIFAGTIKLGGKRPGYSIYFSFPGRAERSVPVLLSDH